MDNKIMYDGPMEICIPDGHNTLKASITCVDNPKLWVIFAHGSGSSHKSKRNSEVAKYLNEQGINTLLFDLLSEEEDVSYRNRFHIPLMADRLIKITHWLIHSPFYKDSGKIDIGFFGGSTGAGVALEAASKISSQGEIPLTSVVSRGGRSDLVDKSSLKEIKQDVLFIVGENDPQVIQLNQEALKHIERARLEIIQGATHLFTEPNALEEVARLSAEEFLMSTEPLMVSSVSFRLKPRLSSSCSCSSWPPWLWKALSASSSRSAPSPSTLSW